MYSRVYIHYRIYGVKHVLEQINFKIACIYIYIVMNLFQSILHLCCEQALIFLNTVDLACYKIDLTIILSGHIEFRQIWGQDPAALSMDK